MKNPYKANRTVPRLLLPLQLQWSYKAVEACVKIYLNFIPAWQKMPVTRKMPSFTVNSTKKAVCWLEVRYDVFILAPVSHWASCKTQVQIVLLLLPAKCVNRDTNPSLKNVGLYLIARSFSTKLRNVTGFGIRRRNRNSKARSCFFTLEVPPVVPRSLRLSSTHSSSN